MSGRDANHRADETETEYADRLTRAHMDKCAARYDAMRERVLNAAGWTFRMSRHGYGRHVGTRDARLPEDIKRWIEKGCPDA